MPEEYTFEELKRRVSEFGTGKREAPADIEAAIRRAIRASKSDQRMVIALRLLLGELLYCMREYDKARRQYRKVLEQEPESIDAMIKMGDSFTGTGRPTRAKAWFNAALAAAEARGNHAGQIQALDSLASDAFFQGDLHTVSDALGRMCRVVVSAPRMECIHLIVAPKTLVLEGCGQVALPYIRCLIRHVLERAYDRGYLYDTFSAFVEVRRQEGHLDDEIRQELYEFRYLAANDEVASDFDIAVGWSFGPGRHFCDCLSRVPSDRKPSANC